MSGRSQFNEDIYIYNKFFKGRREGFYFEAGAMDGNIYSNTKLLNTKGFTGILVEPDVDMFNKLKVNRPQDTTLNYIIGNHGKKFMRSHIIKSMNWVDSVNVDAVKDSNISNFKLWRFFLVQMYAK